MNMKKSAVKIFGKDRIALVNSLPVILLLLSLSL